MNINIRTSVEDVRALQAKCYVVCVCVCVCVGVHTYVHVPYSRIILNFLPLLFTQEKQLLALVFV